MVKRFFHRDQSLLKVEISWTELGFGRSKSDLVKIQGRTFFKVLVKIQKYVHIKFIHI